MLRQVSAAPLSSAQLSASFSELARHAGSQAGTSQAAKPFRSLALLCLVVALLLGAAGFGYSEARRSAREAAVLQSRIALLDQEISGRIYQWLALSNTVEAEERAFSNSSSFSLFYGQLIRRPGAEEVPSFGVQAVLAEFQERGLLSLVLELADYVDQPSAAQLQSVASLLVRPDPILEDCRSARECASVVAMNILLDRWRQ